MHSNCLIGYWYFYKYFAQVTLDALREESKSYIKHASQAVFIVKQYKGATVSYPTVKEHSETMSIVSGVAVLFVGLGYAIAGKRRFRTVLRNTAFVSASCGAAGCAYGLTYETVNPHSDTDLFEDTIICVGFGTCVGGTVAFGLNSLWNLLTFRKRR